MYYGGKCVLGFLVKSLNLREGAYEFSTHPANEPITKLPLKFHEAIALYVGLGNHIFPSPAQPARHQRLPRYIEE